MDLHAGRRLVRVDNHKVQSLFERWQLDSNQLLIKLQYALRM